MTKHEFESYDMFTIHDHGFVFRGEVKSGTFSVGDTISVTLNGKTVTATLSSMEKDRKLIENSLLNYDLGFLLNNFSDPEMNRLYSALPKNQDLWENLPSARDELNIKFPITVYQTN